MRDSDSALFADAAIVWHPETSILKLLSETHEPSSFAPHQTQGTPIHAQLLQFSAQGGRLCARGEESHVKSDA